MKKIIHFSACLSFLLMWTTMGKVAHAYDLSTYLPLFDGNYLTYDQTVDGNSTGQVVVSAGADTFIGGILTKPVSTSANSGDLEQLEFLAWGSNGFQVHQHEEKVRTGANLQTFTGAFTSPAGAYRLLFPMTLGIGGTVSYSGIVEEVKDASGQVIYKRNISSDVTLTGIQSVTVPAGTFSNCLALAINETVYITDPSGTTLDTITRNTTLYLSYLIGVVQKTVDYTEVDAVTLNTISKTIEEQLAEFIDSDGDYLSDDYETSIGTDPHDRDTDGDGLKDGEEIAIYGFDPLVYLDSDADGMSDDWENAYGLNPGVDDSIGRWRWRRCEQRR